MSSGTEVSHSSGFTLGVGSGMSEQRLDPLGISSWGQPALWRQIPVQFNLSKDLRMLQCCGRVFSGDDSDDTFLTSLHELAAGWLW